jgi:hypothetical protein
MVLPLMATEVQRAIALGALDIVNLAVSVISFQPPAGFTNT